MPSDAGGGRYLRNLRLELDTAIAVGDPDTPVAMNLLAQILDRLLRPEISSHPRGQLPVTRDAMQLEVVTSCREPIQPSCLRGHAC